MKNTTITNTDYAAQRTKLAAADYNPDTHAQLAWLLDLAEERGWSLAKLAGDIGMSSTTLSRLIGGTYHGDRKRNLGLIAAFRERYESRRTVADEIIVETSIARKIWQAIDYASQYQEIVSIIGNSQWGKTTACEEYRRRKLAAGSDAVIMIRLGVKPCPSGVARQLGKTLGLPQRSYYAERLDALKRTLSSRHVLIVDEVHQAATSRQNGLNTIEMLRELYDASHCGMVLVGTNVWGRVLEGDTLPEWQGVLGQTMLRGISVTLPPKLGYRDQQAIWTAYGLPEPGRDDRAVVQDIVEDYGLGRLVKRMRAAKTAATRAGKPFEWRHFVGVHRQLEALEGGNYTDEDE